MKTIEETMPAEADSGMRRIAVEAGDGSRIVLLVMQEMEPVEVEGETHRQGIQPSREVVANRDLATALVQVAACCLTQPLRQSLAQEEDGR